MDIKNQQMKEIIVGTRGSKLALWQAHFVQDQLSSIGVKSTLKIIKTKGDKIQHLGFDKLEGKGFFTKEIEDQLLDGSIDMAVHSMKDLPTQSPEGLVLAATSYREDARDTILINKDAIDESKDLKLKAEAIVGTSSVRRKSQLVDLKSDITIKDIRGNVPTRIQKLRDGDFDAIILASAGLTRLELDLDDLYRFDFHVREFVPAPAQGVLAFQCRVDDIAMRKTLMGIHHHDVAVCTNVERSVLQMMDGGCHVPLGVHCFKDQAGNYQVHAAYSKSIDQPLTRFNYSQSTTNGLADLIYKKLTQ